MIHDHEISVWCEASIHCSQSLWKSWHRIKEGLNMFPSMHFICESTKNQEWLLEDCDEQVADRLYPRNVLQHECVGQGICDTCGSSKKTCTILSKYGWALSCWNMEFRVAWERSCETSLMYLLLFRLLWICHIFYPVAPQTITLGVSSLCHSTMQDLRLNSPW